MSIRAAIAHLRYRRFLDAHIDRELTDPVRARRVADHVGHCPMCRNAVRTTEVVKQRLTLWHFLPTHQRTRLRREER